MKVDISNSLIGEFIEHNRLFLLGSSRTSTGSGSFTSSTSGTVYTYTSGQNDLYNQLHVVLVDSLISAQEYNNIISDISDIEHAINIYGASSVGTDAYRITFSTPFTTLSTFQVDSTTAYAINVLSPTGLVATKTGDIIAGVPIKLIFVGGGVNKYVLINPTSILTSLLTAQGDIIYASGANTPERLAKGTARQILAMNSGATAPEWIASLQSLITASGDIIYGSAANTPAVLAKTTDGFFLKLVAGLPAWSALGISITSGNYTGNNAGSRDITLGFRPKLVVIVPHTQNNFLISVDDGSTSDWFNHATATVSDTTIFNGSTSTGFRTGSSTDVNANGIVYRYFAIF